jgi:hypothetical protein
MAAFGQKPDGLKSVRGNLKSSASAPKGDLKMQT